MFVKYALLLLSLLLRLSKVNIIKLFVQDKDLWLSALVWIAMPLAAEVQTHSPVGTCKSHASGKISIFKQRTVRWEPFFWEGVESWNMHLYKPLVLNHVYFCHTSCLVTMDDNPSGSSSSFIWFSLFFISQLALLQTWSTLIIILLKKVPEFENMTIETKYDFSWKLYFLMFISYFSFLFFFF